MLPRPSATDWESAAGPLENKLMTLDRLAYTYRGFEDPHWLGQSCCILGAEDGERIVVVRFACGCQAAVPSCAVQPKHPVANRELVGATAR